MGHTVEMEMKVWNDKDGSRVVVRDDSDGLGLVEIVSYDDDDREEGRIVLPIEAAKKLIDAMSTFIDYREQNPLGD